MANHEKYIKRCFNLAINGLGFVSPNPLVGCVIVHNDKIIGEGFHQKFGEAHAEINAINSVKDKSLLPQSTLYVNLEPCSHYGKTPPCTNRIIEEKIPKVIISNIDPFEKVAGKGVEILKNSGIEVITDVLKEEGQELNKRFFTFQQQKRPYIILKWAQTIDGFMDIERIEPGNNKKYWITNDELKIVVHKWRSEEDAIMIGSNTVINDNPQLNVRNWTGRNPVRVVIDTDGKLNEKLKFFDGTQETILFTSNKYSNINNIEQIELPKENILNFVFDILYKKNIQSIIIEGGKCLLQSLIKQGLWDEARVLTGNKYFVSGLEAPKLTQKPTEQIYFSKDYISLFYNK